MNDALILWALGRSRKLRWLQQVYLAIQSAKSGEPTPVKVRGIRADGEIYDLDGTLRKRTMWNG